MCSAYSIWRHGKYLMDGRMLLTLWSCFQTTEIGALAQCHQFCTDSSFVILHLMVANVLKQATVTLHRAELCSVGCHGIEAGIDLPWKYISMCMYNLYDASL